MSGDRIPITQEGYDKRKAELDHLTNVEMPAVAARIAAAREMGDLRENAEYHAAREAQGMLQAKIDYLKDQLSRAIIVDTNDMPKDQVAFGARVRVHDMDLDEEEVFHIVGPGEDDIANNRILASSPMGQALVGKKIGEVAEFNAPMGTLRFQVKEISYPS